MEILGRQDEVAPKYRVSHVPAKEEYLFMDWSNGEARAVCKAICHPEYAQAACCTKKQAD